MRAVIERVTDLDAIWPELWPLRRAASEHHRSIDPWERPMRSEEAVFRHHVSALADGRTMLLLAREGGEAVGCGFASISPGAWSRDETVGYLGDFYIRPESRGTTLVLRMHEMLERWLVEQGVSHAERDTVATNERTLALWQHLGFQPYIAIMRRDGGPGSEDASPAVPGVKPRIEREIGPSWEAIWPLLQELDYRRFKVAPCEIADDRPARRLSSLEKGLEKRGRAVIAAGSDGVPAGFMMVRIQQAGQDASIARVRMSDLAVAPGQPLAAIAGLLVSAASRWAGKKGASVRDGEVLIADREMMRLWEEWGHQPASFHLRKRLNPQRVRPHAGR